MTFLDHVRQMPFHIIDKAEFQSLGITITFKSGNKLTAKSQCPKMYKEVQDEFITNLGESKVLIYDN